MLGQDAVLEPHHVGGHPCRGSPVTRKAAVDDDVVGLRQNQAVLVAQAVGKAADKPEQPFATGFDVGAVLNVLVGPEAGRRVVVTFIEQRVECFEHECLVLLRCGPDHVLSFAFDGIAIWIDPARVIATKATVITLNREITTAPRLTAKLSPCAVATAPRSSETAPNDT